MHNPLGMGDGDFSRGRKFSAEDLQVLLVALLVDEPRHGYELMRLLDTRSNGFYAPSPGMVYPALNLLEDRGYATVSAEGNRKRYAITAAGRAYCDANRESIDFLWAKLSFFARKMGMVRRALAGKEAADAKGARRPLTALLDARHRLEQLLLARGDASFDEQLLIAQVLERAAAQIAAQAESSSKDNHDAALHGA